MSEVAYSAQNRLAWTDGDPPVTPRRRPTVPGTDFAANSGPLTLIIPRVFRANAEPARSGRRALANKCPAEPVLPGRRTNRASAHRAEPPDRGPTRRPGVSPGRRVTIEA